MVPKPGRRPIREGLGYPRAPSPSGTGKNVRKGPEKVFGTSKGKQESGRCFSN
jgi:hypothetical protein